METMRNESTYWRTVVAIHNWLSHDLIGNWNWNWYLVPKILGYILGIAMGFLASTIAFAAFFILKNLARLLWYLAVEGAKEIWKHKRAGIAGACFASVIGSILFLVFAPRVNWEPLSSELTGHPVIGPSATGCLGEYNIEPYATDTAHERLVHNILDVKMSFMDKRWKIDKYIRQVAPRSPITGDMVMRASAAYAVDTRLIMTLMEHDSNFGTLGKGARTHNPGNVGNDDNGNLKDWVTWQAGVNAIAEWLSRHRKIIKPKTETAGKKASSDELAFSFT